VKPVEDSGTICFDEKSLKGLLEFGEKISFNQQTMTKPISLPGFIFYGILYSLYSILLFPATAMPVHFDSPGGYQSPYSLQFVYQEDRRSKGWDKFPWASPDEWGRMNRAQWYNKKAYQNKSYVNLAYGVPSITFPRPDFITAMPADLRRERVLTAARNMIGMRYQHHHVPTFDPYTERPDWPWIKVSSGVKGGGLDCSNFISWVYNYALGIHLNGSVIRAAAQTVVPGAEGREFKVQTLQKQPGDTFESFVAQLKPADILYIKNKKGNISHCILWVGTLATDSNNKDKYFIIDSTGGEIVDSNGTHIPDGAEIRPFRKDSWYFNSLSHAHRLIK